MTARSSDPISQPRRQWLAACIVALATGDTRAQGRTARLVVGFGPGGTSDVAARAVSGSLREAMGGEVIVENRSGAGGRLAVEHVRSAAPEGGVALLVPDAMMFLYPHVYRSLGYDPERDLVPVARLANLAIALYVGPMVPATVVSVADFVAWVRADSRRAVFGTSAAGATPHFVGEMLARAAGLHETPPVQEDEVVDLVGRQLGRLDLQAPTSCQSQAPGSSRQPVPHGAQHRVRPPIASGTFCAASPVL